MLCECLHPWEPVSRTLPTLASSSVSLPLEVKLCTFLTDWTINRALQYIRRGSQPGGNRCHFVCGFLCLLKLLVSDQFVKWLLYSTGCLQMCKGCCCPSPSSGSNCHLLIWMQIWVCEALGKHFPLVKVKGVETNVQDTYARYFSNCWCQIDTKWVSLSWMCVWLQWVVRW